MWDLLTKEPWRKTEGWGESVREKLKQHVAQLAPKCRGNKDVPSSFRVVLTGKISDGKSSVINSLKSVYRDRVVLSDAAVGEAATSLTKEFRVYEIWNKNTQPRRGEEVSHDLLSWKICDTMGLSSGSEDQQDVKNVLAAVDGHVPDGHEFTLKMFTQNSHGYISNPVIADRAHCIAVVIAADNFVHMGDEMVEKLKYLRRELIGREIPTFIILTKVDLVCKAVRRNVTTVYRSIAVRDLVSQVGKMLHGLPEGQIFPVVNYKEQTELEENMDILLLYAVRQMLYSAQVYLEKHSQTLVAEPWRKTEGWGESIREKLKQHVAQLAPECRGNMDVPSFRLVLTGHIGAGKSSVYNSLNTVYRDRVVLTAAGVGKTATSLTKKFSVYKIKEKVSGNPLKWKICDTMGLSSGSDDQDVKNILSAVDGHVPDRHVFTCGDFTQNSFGYISNPAIADRAHCIAVVIAADKFEHMNDKMKENLRNLRMELIKRETPTFIILTKVDLVCEAVGKDVTTVYRSIAVRDLVSKVGKMLHGLPEGQIFPVVNYKKQTELDENMDILLLYAVRQMLYSAQAYLEKHM